MGSDHMYAQPMYLSLQIDYTLISARMKSFHGNVLPVLLIEAMYIDLIPGFQFTLMYSILKCLST